VVQGSEDQHEGQGEFSPASSASASQLQSYVGAGDDETRRGDIVRRAVLEAGIQVPVHTFPVLNSTSNYSTTFTSTSFSLSPSSSSPNGLKRQQQNSTLTGAPAKQRKNADRSTPSPFTTISASPSSSNAGEKPSEAKRLKEWRGKADSGIAEVEKVLEETSARIDSEEQEVIKLNNVLAGLRGKRTVSDSEHLFSRLPEKLRRKSEIDSLSVELEQVSRSRKAKQLDLLRALSSVSKEYLDLVQKEKEEIQSEIDQTPFHTQTFR